MLRLFTGLAIPEKFHTQISLLQGGIPGARWTKPENYHVTLTFIGEAGEDTAEDIHEALSSVRASAFDLEISATGNFAQGEDSKVLWLGVKTNPALHHLKERIDRALDMRRIDFQKRKYTPHMTLARFRHAPDKGKVADFMQAHNLFALPPFPVEEFILYNSHLGSEGPAYEVLERYPLLSSNNIDL